MFDDPQIVKLLIYGLAGVCAVLFLTVLVLAFKRNIYYVDENGAEIEKPTKTKKKKVNLEHEAKEAPVLLESKQITDDVVEEKLDVTHAIQNQGVPLEALRKQVEPEIEKTNVVPVIRDVAIQHEEVVVPAVEKEAINETVAIPVMPKVEEKIKGALVMLTVNGASRERVIEHLPCLIGRESASCDFVILEPAVSRRHARVLLMNNELYIEDVSEHNGTFVNGIKLPSMGRMALKEGDVINLGRSKLEILKLLY